MAHLHRHGVLSVAQKITIGCLFCIFPSDYGEVGHNRTFLGMEGGVVEAMDGNSLEVLYLWSPEYTSETQLYTDMRRACIKDDRALR